MKTFVLLVALLAGISDAGERPAVTRLELVGPHRVVWQRAARTHDRFSISFMHSSERCRWTHQYEILPGRIRQIDSTFRCFGAGMPVAGDDGSPLRRTPGGYSAIAHAELVTLTMMAWRAAEISIEFQGDEIPVGLLFDDFEPMLFRVR